MQIDDQKKSLNLSPKIDQTDRVVPKGDTLAKEDPFQPFFEKLKTTFSLKDNDSLALLSAKHLVSNIGRIYIRKDSAAHVRKTLRKWKMTDSPMTKTPEIDKSRFLKSSNSPERENKAIEIKVEDHSVNFQRPRTVFGNLEFSPQGKDFGNPLVLETWINERLMEIESLEFRGEKFIPWENKNTLKRYGLDRQSLEGNGMSKEAVDRLFRCLFVYSAGFYEYISELFDKTTNKFRMVSNIWRVFWTLLEYFYRAEHQAVLEEVDREKKEFIGKLFDEIEKKESELVNMEKWQQECLENFNKDLQTLKTDKENLEKEKSHLKDDIKINEKVYSDEVQLRIQFENKINEFYANYHDIKAKYERTAEEAKFYQKNNEELTTENASLKSKLSYTKKKIMYLEENLKLMEERLAGKDSALSQLILDKEQIEKKLIEAFKANQAIDLGKLESHIQNITFKLEASTSLNEMYQKNVSELEKLISTKNQEIKYWEEKFKALEIENGEKMKEFLEVEKERIKHQDFSKLLQEKLTVCNERLEVKKQQYERLFEECSSLKHQLNAEKEKTEIMGKERDNAEENLLTLDKVRVNQEQEIENLEKMLDEEIERVSTLQAKLEHIQKEQEKLDAIALEQSHMLTEKKERVQVLEERLKELKDELTYKEEQINQLSKQEREIVKFWNSKLEEEQEKKKELRLELIELQQIVDKGATEKNQYGARIIELKTLVQTETKKKEETILLLEKANGEIEKLQNETILKKEEWKETKTELDKKISNLAKKLSLKEEKSFEGGGYHPMVVEDLLSIIQRNTMKINELEARHYNDLQRLTNVENNLREARTIHKRLHALSESLLADKNDLQNKLENKEFTIDKYENLIKIHTQRQETLQMEVNDLQQQMVEETLKLKNLQELYHSQLSKEASMKSGLMRVPSGMRDFSDRSIKREGNNSFKTFNDSGSKKNSSRTNEYQRPLHSFHPNRSERSKGASHQPHQRRASKAFMEGTEYLRNQIFKSRPSEKSSSHRTEEKKDKELESLKSGENLIELNYDEEKKNSEAMQISIGIKKEETPNASVDRSEIVPTIEESESVSSSNSDTFSRLPKGDDDQTKKEEDVNIDNKANNVALQSKISLLDLNQNNKGQIDENEDRENKPQRSTQVLQKLAYVDEFFSQPLNINNILKIAIYQNFKSDHQELPTLTYGNESLSDLGSEEIQQSPISTPWQMVYKTNAKKTSPERHGNQETKDPLYQSPVKSNNENVDLSELIYQEKTSQQKFRGRSQHLKNMAQSKFPDDTQSSEPKQINLTGFASDQQKNEKKRMLLDQSVIKFSDDHMNSASFEKQRESKNSVDLPPIRRRTPINSHQVLQRRETTNFPSNNNAKNLDYKRFNSINFTDSVLQRETNSSLSMYQQFFSTNPMNTNYSAKQQKKNSISRDLNKTMDSILNIDTRTSKEERFQGQREGVGENFHIISELDSSHRSSTGSNNLTKGQSRNTPSQNISKEKNKTEKMKEEIKEAKKEENFVKKEKKAEEEEGKLDTDMRILVDVLLGRYNATETGGEILRPQVDVKGLVDKMKGSLAYYIRESVGNKAMDSFSNEE